MLADLDAGDFGVIASRERTLADQGQLLSGCLDDRQLQEGHMFLKSNLLKETPVFEATAPFTRVEYPSMTGGK